MKYEDDARKENSYTSTAFYGQKGCGAHNDKCMEKQACFSAIQALAQQLALQGTPEPEGAPAAGDI